MRRRAGMAWVLMAQLSLSTAAYGAIAATGTVDQLCSTLGKDQWGEVTGHTGLGDAVRTGGNSGHIFTYGNHGVWDEAGNVGYYSGGDHCCGDYFVKFELDTQRWTRVSGAEAKHARSENWYDPDSRRYGYGLSYRNLPDESNLRSIPRDGGFYGGAGNHAYVYIRGKGLVDFQAELVHGRYLADVTRSNWVDLDFSGVDIDTDHFAVYSPMQNGAYFGGGALECRNTLYFMDSNLNTRALPSFPGAGCLSVKPGDQSFWSDPITGDLFVLQDASPVQVWRFEFAGERWQRLADMPHFAYQTNNEHLVIPIYSRQCAIIAEYDQDGAENMWVYKHGAAGPPDTIPEAPPALDVE